MPVCRAVAVEPIGPTLNQQNLGNGFGGALCVCDKLKDPHLSSSRLIPSGKSLLSPEKLQPSAFLAVAEPPSPLPPEPESLNPERTLQKRIKPKAQTSKR